MGLIGLMEEWHVFFGVFLRSRGQLFDWSGIAYLHCSVGFLRKIGFGDRGVGWLSSCFSLTFGTKINQTKSIEVLINLSENRRLARLSRD